MLKKGKRQGFLVVVLIMSLLFFIIAVAVCSYLGVQYSIMGESEQSLRAFYAADSGVQYALGLMALQAGANSSMGRYFGYLNGTTFRSYSSSYVTLYGSTGNYENYSNPDNTLNVIPVRPMPQEVGGWSAMEYLYTVRDNFSEDFGYWRNLEVYGDFAWKLLWDDGVGTAVYFTVVRSTQFPNGAAIRTPPPNIPESGFSPNTALSYNEQISKVGLANSLYNPGNPCWAQYLTGTYAASNCANPPNLDYLTQSHIHCRYTIKSIGEVWAYHWDGAYRRMDRALARRTVMAEIGTVMPIDKQFFNTTTHTEVTIVTAGQILRWYEVFR
ncbi:MAG: hypothetical protein V2A78_02145 [bacterium]